MKQRKLNEKLIKKYRVFLAEEEKSQNTVQKYMRDIKAFFGFCGEKAVTKACVLEYKANLCQSYAPRSVNSVISSLNSFFDFLGWYELKTKVLKIQKRIFADKEKELSKEEYEKLLCAARQNKRLYYLMQTVASTGLRVSEIKYITCEAIKNGQAVINCKGKLRQIFLPKKLCRMLKNYAAEQKITSGSIFVSKNGKPLDRSNIWRMFKNLCKAAGVNKEKVFPHNFRHLFARTFYSMEKDIARLADILGHSSIETTRIYTMESGEIHKKQIQRLGLLRC